MSLLLLLLWDSFLLAMYTSYHIVSAPPRLPRNILFPLVLLFSTVTAPFVSPPYCSLHTVWLAHVWLPPSCPLDCSFRDAPLAARVEVPPNLGKCSTKHFGSPPEFYTISKTSKTFHLTSGNTGESGTSSGKITSHEILHHQSHGFASCTVRRSLTANFSPWMIPVNTSPISS